MSSEKRIEKKLPQDILSVLEDTRKKLSNIINTSGDLVYQIETTKKRIKEEDSSKRDIIGVIDIPKLPQKVRSLLKEYLVDVVMNIRAMEKELQDLENALKEKEEEFFLHRKKIERVLRQFIETDCPDIEANMVQELAYDYENGKVILIVVEPEPGIQKNSV